MPEQSRRPFRDLPLEDYPLPELNPYLKLHREFGREIITADAAPSFRGRWHEAFERQAPLHLEIGTGNGSFLATMADRHRDWNWIGIEIRFKRVVQGARRLAAMDLPHARIARYDAFFLADLFASGSLAGIYLNHPDPWPKGRQEKHRLIAPAFLAWVADALEPGGTLRLKTDALHNVESLIGCASALPFQVEGRSDDVAGLGAPWQGDVVTGYQAKFDKVGTPVRAVLLRRR